MIETNGDYFTLSNEVTVGVKHKISTSTLNGFKAIAANEGNNVK